MVRGQRLPNVQDPGALEETLELLCNDKPLPMEMSLEIQSGSGESSTSTPGFCGPVPHVPRIHAAQVRRAALCVLFVFCCCPCCSLDMQLNSDPRDCIINRRKPRWMDQNGDAEREGEEV